MDMAAKCGNSDLVIGKDLKGCLTVDSRSIVDDSFSCFDGRVCSRCLVMLPGVTAAPPQGICLIKSKTLLAWKVLDPMLTCRMTCGTTL